MSRNRNKRLSAEPVRVTVETLAHDGRGVARVNEKTVFIDGALPGEEVLFRYVATHRNYDEGAVAEVLSPSPDRVQPRCPHYGVCGGCSFQHLAPEQQIVAKQKVLMDDLRHIGKVTLGEVLPPLTGPHWGYRRKARLGVRFVMKKDKLLVGFREKHSNFLADLSRCETLHPSVGGRLAELGELVRSLEAYDHIPQIEVAVDDEQTALVFRHMVPLTEADRERLRAYAQAQDLRIFLQPGGTETIAPLWPEHIQLGYSLPAFDVSFRFEPSDFTQVNTDINRAMVERALDLLDLKPEERVLDLFCGLGNFTLPIARRAASVVGVEGSADLVKRARENAERNGIGNATFHAADLAADLSHASWWQGGFDKVLLDPPRSGAQETLAHLAKLKVGRIVYVSCNPATLARDAGVLVNEHGYVLEKAGVMDMFPHTAHVESIALFTRKRK
ncbi:MAG: 23S rRNA (uracil(1939)-C(5))-methyltransferase RlmD [Thiohalomonadaceae bacterium]